MYVCTVQAMCEACKQQRHRKIKCYTEGVQVSGKVR